MERKLLLGIILILVSMIIGLLYKFYILASVLGNQFDWKSLLNAMVDPVVAWATIVYVLSWPMLFIGIYLCGKEGLKAAGEYTKYLTYKHYHDAAARRVPVAKQYGVKNTKQILVQKRKKR